MSQAAPPPPPHDPKAAAAAAKAYAKASRPWFKKKRWWAAIIILVIIIAAALGSGGEGDDDKDSAAENAKTSQADKNTSGENSGDKSDAKPAAFGSDKLPLQNGDWRLDSIKVKNDGLGSFSATGRITYTGDDDDGGNNIFTVTLFKGKDVVGTLQGGANTVMPGKTVSVQFISTDDYVKGPYKYDFQNDL